jgi:hypothetical protein
MAVANILAAKRAGYSDQEIAQYLSEQAGADYQSAVSAGYNDKEIISHLNKQDLSFGEAFMAGAKAEALSEVTGAKQIVTGEVSPEQVEKENLARQAFQERPIATGLGMVAGGLINPSTLIPGSLLFKGAKGLATGGAVAGGVSGAVRPIYTEEDMGRGTGAVVGAAAGGALGFGLGKAVERFGSKAGKVEADNIPTPRLPDADQAAIDKVLSRYEDVDLLPKKAFDEIADAVQSTNPEAAALFRGAKELPEAKTVEGQAALLKADVADPIAQQQAAVVKASFDQKAAVKTAKVSEDPIAESSAYQKAEQTGDYRDFLTDPIRNYPLSPTQFAKMIAPENPFKGQNLKTALTTDDKMTDALQQLIGPTFGRFNREKASKTWQQVEIKGESVPYETAVSAFVNRKQEEVLGAELTSRISKALASELNQLDQLKEVARLAKEQNNEEMYAYIAQQFSKVNALASSLDGNISNLGRALAYTKQVKQMINANGTLPPYLGGLKC